MAVPSSGEVRSPGHPTAAALALVIFSVSGCEDPTTAGANTRIPEAAPQTAAVVECDATSPRALAVVAGDPCPTVVEPGAQAGSLVLRTTGRPTATRAEGVLPGACEPPSLCDLSGVETAAGAVLLAIRLGHESEVPEGAWVGLVHEGSLSFLPLWRTAPSTVDGTREGPGYALAPHTCGDGLALLVRRRLPEVSGETAPESLLAGEGRLLPPAEGARSWTTTPMSPRDRERCEALALVLP
jgi:hypothetical protein